MPVAPVLHAQIHTSVPSVERPTMGLSDALFNLNRIHTELIPEQWESTLRELGLWDQFSDVPDGLRFGFRIGTKQSITNTFIPKNHNSALAQPQVIENHINEELAAGRYSGPYTRETLEQAMGPFRCAPLGVVSKASDPGKFRVIQDFSYPRDNSLSSLNSQINSEDFGCVWGCYPDVAAAVAAAHLEAKAATCDVRTAYRQVPTAPEDRAHLVVHWEGKFYIDGNVPFGAASSNGLFARVGDAAAVIYERLGFGKIFKWVDDFLFIQDPLDARYSPGPSAPKFSVQAIYEVGDKLGLPWKRSKTRPFASTFNYLGFEWDLSTKRVLIPEAKRLKYLRRIQSWFERPSSTLKEVESIVGCLIHCALAMLIGRPRLSALIAFSATFPHEHRFRFLRKSIPKLAETEARWWLESLQGTDCSSSIGPTPANHPIQIVSDASTSFGIGVIIDNQWWAWRLLHGWKSDGRDIGWAEAVALELAVDGAILSGVRNAAITCHCDNQGVVHAWAAGRSRNVHQNSIILRIMTKALAANLHVQVRYIRSKDNPADAPSRGLAPREMSPATFAIPTPLDIAPFIAHTSL